MKSKFNTEIEALRNDNPEMIYQDGKFYPHKDYDVKGFDDALTDSQGKEELDADQIIIDYFTEYEDSEVLVNADWIKHTFGSFENAFEKAL